MQKRQDLVQMIQEKSCTIAVAARRLNIIQSTARMIVSKYHKTGTFPIKHFVKRPLRTPSVPPALTLPPEVSPPQLQQKDDSPETPLARKSSPSDSEVVKAEVKV